MCSKPGSRILKPSFVKSYEMRRESANKHNIKLWLYHTSVTRSIKQDKNLFIHQKKKTYPIDVCSQYVEEKRTRSRAVIQQPSHDSIFNKQILNKNKSNYQKNSQSPN